MARRRTTGKGMGPRGKLGSRASQRTRARFKARVAAGKSGLTGGAKGDKSKGTTTIGNYRAAQRQQVVNAAKDRNDAFQAARAGLDSNKLGAEATRLTGIPSGDALRPGMLTFSKEGIAEAEANKKAAQEATRKSTFDPSRLFSDKAFSQYMQAGGISNINRNVFNNPNNYLNRGLNTSFQNESTIPFGSPRSYFQKYPNPNSLFGNDALQVGKSDQNFLAGKRGNPFGRPDQAFNIFRPAEKGGPGSGPTPLTRETIKRFGPTTLNFASSFIPGYNIGKQIFNEGRTGSALDTSLKNVDNVNVGGLSIGFNSPESTDIGARVGRFFTSLPSRISDAFTGDDTKIASTDAGGLNIGGGDEGGETGATARTLTARFKRPGFDTLAGGLDFATDDRFDFDNSGKGLFGFGAVTPSNVINDAMSLAQNKNLTINDMGTFVNAVKDITTSDDKFNTVKNLISNEDTTKTLLGPVYNQLRNSEIVDSLATKKLKLPDNYGEQLDATKSALDKAYSSLGDDNKKNRRIISDLFIGKDPNLNLLKRAAEQFTNESGTITDYDSKTKLAKFQDSFKENSPLFKGLNRDERGLIGGLGNWRLSNLGTKIAGRTLEGTDNFADLASNIIETAGTDKATQSFMKTIGADGAPTPKTVIEGLIPRFSNEAAKGAGTPVQGSSNRVSNDGKGLGINQQVAEELIPLISRAQQAGTSASQLSQLQNQAYNNQMSLYGMNPNYFASFMQPSFNRPRTRFRTTFNRDYFSQFV